MAIALALAFTAPAGAAPGGDATIMATGSLTVPNSMTGTGLVMCPAGTRALGGGAQPLNGISTPNNNAYRVAFSGPVDDSGTPAATSTGDIPRGWSVVVSIFSAPETTFRLYAICSATSDATIQSMALVSVTTTTERTVACPAGTRAVGGGVITPTAVPASEKPFLIRSLPVDASGTVAGTQTGDVATGWLVSGGPQSVAEAKPYNYIAICSASSDATVQAAPFNVFDDNTIQGSNSAAATCPAGQRALSGGIGIDAIGPAGENYRIQRSGPLDAGATPEGTDVGDEVASWYGAARMDLGGPGSSTSSWRTIALCATSDVPVTPPPGGGDTTPPDTVKGKGPKKKTTKRKASFEFSSEPGATFECQLDKKPPAACTSPAKVKKLKPGKHKLTVIAIDAAGNRDGSPVVFGFKVKKPKQ